MQSRVEKSLLIGNVLLLFIHHFFSSVLSTLELCLAENLKEEEQHRKRRIRGTGVESKGWVVVLKTLLLSIPILSDCGFEFQQFVP